MTGGVEKLLITLHEPTVIFHYKAGVITCVPSGNQIRLFNIKYIMSEFGRRWINIVSI